MVGEGNYNAAADLVDGNVAAKRGDKVAFIDPSTCLTYEGLQKRTCQVANLLCGAGIRREERVALILLDTVMFPSAFLGAMRAGTVPVAINTLLSTEIYRYILDDSRATILFISSALLPVVEPILKDLKHLKHVYVDGDDSGQYPSLGSAVCVQSADFDTADTKADDTAFWLYSSGSTGMPKGAQHVHSSLRATADTYGRQVLGIREDDVVFSAAKLFFAYGLGNGMTFPMSVGATAFLLPQRPTPESVFGALKSQNPTLFFGVPTLFGAMLAYPGCGREISSTRLRMCISAGEALPSEIGRTWRTKFDVDILDGVGSTELLHIFLSNRPDDVRYGSSGRAVPGYDLRLVDEEGSEVNDGEIGELLVRGNSSASGYWNQREKSRSTFEGLWTRTGDKYTREGEYYVFCGRTDDMFKVSGIWVSPFEVEGALMSHESVLEAAVVPAEDEESLLKPKAYVVLNEGFTGDEALFETLKAHVKSKIGAWKYPRWIEFAEELPKTATGKIQRFKLHS